MDAFKQGWRSWGTYWEEGGRWDQGRRGALLGSRGTHSSELLQVLVLFLARGQPLQGSKENAAWESELSANRWGPSAPGGYSSTCIPSPLGLSTQLEAPGTKTFGDWLALVMPYGKKG